MGVSGQAFAISLGVNAAVCAGVLTAFGFLRKVPFIKKFYAPKRYEPDVKIRPRRLPMHFWSWICYVIAYKEADVIQIAGMDAAMLINILNFGVKLFVFATLLSCIAILPVNLLGTEVDRLNSNPSPATSEFTYWLPSPTPNGEDNPPVKTPKFYESNVPPAPAGLKWLKYRPEVPALPAAPPSYVWFYDKNYDVRQRQYDFSQLDKATMSNMAKGSSLLWVHAAATWALSLYTYWLLWRYHQHAVALRMCYLRTTNKGAESHTVLVQDIPGIQFGTLLHRLDSTLFRYCPKIVKDYITRVLTKGYSLAEGGVTGAVNIIRTGVPGIANAVTEKAQWGFAELQYVVSSSLPQLLPLSSSSSSRRSSRSSHSTPPTAKQHEAQQTTTTTKQEKRCPSSPLHAASRMTSASSASSASSSFKSTCSVPLDDTSGSSSAAAVHCEAHHDTQLDSQAVAQNNEIVVAVEAHLRKPSWTDLLQPQSFNAWRRVERMTAQGASIAQVVEDEFRVLYGDQLASVSVVVDSSGVVPLWEEYNQNKAKLQDILEHYHSKVARGKKIQPMQMMYIPNPLTYGKWGIDHYGPKPRKVDALKFLPDRLAELRTMIALEQEKAQTMPVPAAFVTFNYRKSQVMCCSSMMHQDLSAWRTRAAPAHTEVVWQNLKWRYWERLVRGYCVWTAFIVMTLFYLIPITAVQGIINAALLVPAIKSAIAAVPLLDALLSAILPSIVLKLFLALLPSLLSWMCTIQGMVAKSEIDFGVVHRYFYFQVVTVFLAQVVVGSIANQIQQFVEDPSSLLTILGATTPQTSIFFTTYIMLQGLSAYPIAFLRAPELVRFIALTRLSFTERAKSRLWQFQTMKYGEVIPDHVVVILLGLTFSIICPIIAPISLIYFGVNVVIWKYQVLYVYTPDFQIGGRVWMTVFKQISVAIVMMQLTMIAIFAIKNKHEAAMCVLPLPLLTVLYSVVCVQRFDAPQTSLALIGAVELDAREAAAAQKHQEEVIADAPSSSQLYVDPALGSDDAEYEALMKETQKWRDYLTENQHRSTEMVLSPPSPVISLQLSPSSEDFTTNNTTAEANTTHTLL